VNVESFDERSGGIGEIDEVPDRPAELRRSSGPMAWLKDTNHSPGCDRVPAPCAPGAAG